MKSKKWVVFGLIVLLIGMGGYLIIQKSTNPVTQELKIGEANIRYETVSSNEDIARGLSYRQSVPENYGMLFVFPNKGFRSFWMHEMLIPLDIIWISENKVVQIDENVPIKTNGAWTVVNPNYPVDKVLEMKAGEAGRLGIKDGDDLKTP